MSSPASTRKVRRQLPVTRGRSAPSTLTRPLATLGPHRCMCTLRAKLSTRRDILDGEAGQQRVTAVLVVDVPVAVGGRVRVNLDTVVHEVDDPVRRNASPRVEHGFVAAVVAEGGFTDLDDQVRRGGMVMLI